MGGCECGCVCIGAAARGGFDLNIANHINNQYIVKLVAECPGNVNVLGPF